MDRLRTWSIFLSPMSWVKVCVRTGSFFSRLRIGIGLTVASFCVCEILNNIFT